MALSFAVNWVGVILGTSRFWPGTRTRRREEFGVTSQVPAARPRCDCHVFRGAILVRRQEVTKPLFYQLS